jgi:uncharacterized membrane protein YphA (DoxX/SURF4 family)
MKRITILYWVFTGLFAAIMIMSALPDITSNPQAIAFFDHLGYPAYLLPFLGIAKLLGVLVILIPGFSKLKEWAYAGLVFDVTGAIYSGIAVGDPLPGLLFAFAALVLAFVSYGLYHKRIKGIHQSKA